MTRMISAATAAALMVAGPAYAATHAAPIAGRYVTEDGSGLVEIARCGQATCGRLIRILKPRPGAAHTDVNNRIPALRTRAILGMPILSDFHEGQADWRGAIYDPRNGKTYKSIVSRNNDGSLAVKGCIAFFCQTQRWTKVD